MMEGQRGVTTVVQVQRGIIKDLSFFCGFDFGVLDARIEILLLGDNGFV
jgi:hypothetical protein